MFLTEADHFIRPFHTESSLQAAGFVVDAGMNHTTVMTCLMCGYASSLSMTATEMSGKRVHNSRPVASPTIPAPIIATSNGEELKVIVDFIDTQLLEPSGFQRLEAPYFSRHTF